jgi:hypothetical protein
VAAAESAELVLGKPRGSAGDLADALEGFDPLAAQRELDALLAGPEPEAGVAGVLPLIAKLGPERRHVARRMLETRLLALGDRWHEGPGRLALVGCGPDEDDTLPAIVCALALRRRGWRIVYVGARTPVTAFASAAKTLEPAAIVTVGEVPSVGVTPIGDDPLQTAASL